MDQLHPALNTLRHISEVAPLSEADAPLIEELVATLRKHKALHRFGLTLLHRHFEFLEDELLVETTDIENRTHVVKPVSKDALKHEAYVETAWRLDTGTATTACVCIVSGGDHTGNHQHIPGR